jgi:hypothetical protein
MQVVKSKDVVVGQSYYLDPTLTTYGKVISNEQGSVYFELESDNDGYYIAEDNNTVGFHVSPYIEFIFKEN